MKELKINILYQYIHVKRFYGFLIQSIKAQEFHMLAIRLLTWFKGKLIGKDRYGNCYYTERILIKSKNSKSTRRWVMFKGFAEGSKIPAEWHGWLHHTTEQTPIEKNNTVYEWQKPYSPNLTGTPHAYNPNSAHKKLNLDKMSFKHYTPWDPI